MCDSEKEEEITLSVRVVKQLENVPGKDNIRKILFIIS